MTAIKSTDGPAGMVAGGRVLVRMVFLLSILGCAAWAQVPLVRHVFVVVEENQDFSCVIGNPAMKYFNDLAAAYGLATSYYANSHPSISNYFVLTTGQAISQGLAGDLRTEPVSVDNVIRELKKNNKTWRTYAEGVPKAGYVGGNIKQTHYVKRHNPLAYFESDIPLSERSNLAPLAQLADDLAHDRLANYSFIVPDLFDDAHNKQGPDGRDLGKARCGEGLALERADGWLKKNVDPVIQSAIFKDSGMLIIVFDEASGDDESDGAGHRGGGRVPMVVVSSKVKPGYRSTVLYHHESTLRLTLEALGLNLESWPGAATEAPSMAEFFTPAR